VQQRHSKQALVAQYCYYHLFVVTVPRQVEDGHVITSRGPGTSMLFALRIAHKLQGEETEAKLTKELLLD
jgi:hypothetical protein